LPVDANQEIEADAYGEKVVRYRLQLTRGSLESSKSCHVLRVL
jgi:hypothetical protein